ncbi:MAG: hypothetical protein H6623_01480 [Bdellovibrionaceae bacterium]|nr:hypothetical protein [Pseudobdellovibrionaceae bacterium]
MSLIESKNYRAPTATPTTLFLRSFLPWQVLRFIIINIRMTFMILKSHGKKLKTVKK